METGRMRNQILWEDVPKNTTRFYFIKEAE